MEGCVAGRGPPKIVLRGQAKLKSNQVIFAGSVCSRVQSGQEVLVVGLGRRGRWRDRAVGDCVVEGFERPKDDAAGEEEQVVDGVARRVKREVQACGRGVQAGGSGGKKCMLAHMCVMNHVHVCPCPCHPHDLYEFEPFRHDLST